MRRFLALAALLLAFSPGAAHAGLIDLNGKSIDDFTIELEGRYWLGKLSGDMSADTGAINGTGVDFPHTLGLSTPAKPLIEGVARLHVSKFIIRAAYFQAGFAKTTHLDETVTFQGIKFTVGTDVHSRALVRIAGLDAMFLLLDTGTASKIGLRAAAGIGGRYIGFNGAISETLTGISESTHGTGIIPVIAADLSLGLFNLFSINVSAAGMKIPTNQYLKIEGTFIDASAELRVYLHHLVYLTGGYRFLMLRTSYHGRDVVVDSKLQGWFFGAGISF